MRQISTLLLAMLLWQTSYAQQAKPSEDAGMQALKVLSDELFLQQQASKAAALLRAAEMGWPVRSENEQGEIMELIGLDENGHPEYYATTNTVAAATISTRHLHPGGNLGLNLTGEGTTLGEWDGGAVRVNHREFGNRVVQQDGATELSSHATHVAGTMIASGVTASARGMAYQGNLLAHDWNLDAAEMAIAAANGLLVSNHSYGTITGWRQESGVWYWYGTPSVSQTIDYRFGFYDSRTRDWDQIARNAPFYLIVKSAGNDRNEGPNPGTSHQVFQNGAWVSSTASRDRDGPYDCISTYGTAKNILTVGAINDLTNGYQNPQGVSMSSFSSWGPTDDGRIKPDIVANGVGLYSPSSSTTSSYSTLSGTSMAAPNASGSLILLQQHYRNLFGTNMRSATLKGLVIHTADEAGSDPGPDYRFGWGLMNSRSAARVISNADNAHLLRELTLSNQQVIEIPVYTDGTRPLKATICWTDLPGAPNTPALNNRTPKLVNDLDMRVIAGRGTGQAFLPWVLDPESPASAAGKADNFRDNVEVVEILTPSAGTYVIRIAHKGTLANPQAFSLIVSGVSTPTVTASFNAGARIVCTGDAVAFDNTSEGEDLSYFWEFEGGEPETSTEQSPLVSYKVPGIYNVRLIVSASGVNDTMTQNSYITVLPLVEASARITASATDICEGTEVVFNAAVTNEGSTPVFAWLLNGAPVSGAGGLSYSGSDWKDGDVIGFSLLSDAQCVVNPAMQAEAVTLSVSPIVSPELSISAAGLAVCADASVTIEAAAVNGGSNPVFAWVVNGEWLTQSGSTLLISNPEDASVISAVLYSNARCRDSDSAISNELVIAVFDLPAVPVLSKSGDSLLAPAGFASYRWFLNETFLTATTVPFIIAQVSGNYTVEVTDENECTASSAPLAYVASSVENFAAAGMSVFPNPGNGMFTIETGTQKLTSLRVFDSSGRLVRSQMVTDSGNLFKLDLREVSAGAYILVLEAEERAFVTRLIRQ